MAEKKQIRESMYAKRRALTPSEQDRHAKELFQHFIKHIPIGKNVACYLANDGEIDLSYVLSHLESSDTKIFLPKMEKNHLKFVEYSPRDRLIENGYGILEPVEQNNPQPIDTLDVIFLPCVAVDKNGNRIGRGKGHYDKCLKHINRQKTITVACAHEFQVLAQCPLDPWDIRMDWILTERHAYFCKEAL